MDSENCSTAKMYKWCFSRREKQQRSDVELAEGRWRLWSSNWGFPWNPPYHQITMVLRGLRGCIHTTFWVTLHCENYPSNSFYIEWDMIIVTVSISILNQMEFHLVQNPKENCHDDHILFNVKGIGNTSLSVMFDFPVCVFVCRYYGLEGLPNYQRSYQITTVIWCWTSNYYAVEGF